VAKAADREITIPFLGIVAPLTAMDKSTRIVIIDDSPVRRAVLEEGLREAGHDAIVHLSGTERILERVVGAEPDVIIIGLDDPGRDVLEQMFEVSRAVPRPVAMFVDQADPSSIEAAMEAGVSAYVVDGLRKERVKPILDTCISRYRAFARLRDELDRTRAQLEDRKIVDKAKGLLMQHRALPEADAYALLRRTAMNQKLKLVDVARALVAAADLLR
jgi:two-component system, response regulator / RNA-binding antiterminator